jgi:hypothetical protein
LDQGKLICIHVLGFIDHQNRLRDSAGFHFSIGDSDNRFFDDLIRFFQRTHSS